MAEVVFKVVALVLEYIEPVGSDDCQIPIPGDKEGNGKEEAVKKKEVKICLDLLILDYPLLKIKPRNNANR